MSPVQQTLKASQLHAHCRALTLLDIKREGYVLFEDANTLLSSNEVVADDGTKCSLCVMLLWALRFQPRIRTIPDACVVLYRNPPSWDEPLQRLEVILVSEANRSRLGWASDTGGRWTIGPPDPKPWLVRGHLTVYAAQGFSKCNASFVNKDS